MTHTHTHHTTHTHTHHTTPHTHHTHTPHTHQTPQTPHTHCTHTPQTPHTHTHHKHHIDTRRTHARARFISLSRVNIYHSLSKENEMSLSQESVQTAHWGRCDSLQWSQCRTHANRMVALQCLRLTYGSHVVLLYYRNSMPTCKDPNINFGEDRFP
jgi:hypothetical protein